VTRISCCALRRLTNNKQQQRENIDFIGSLKNANYKKGTTNYLRGPKARGTAKYS